MIEPVPKMRAAAMLLASSLSPTMVAEYVPGEREAGMSCTIQITVILDILISCIPRSEKVWFNEWTNQSCRTP
jgi:hypothetical protein